MFIFFLINIPFTMCYITQYLCFNVRQDLVNNMPLHCIALYIVSYYEPVFSLQMAIYSRNMQIITTYR